VKRNRPEQHLQRSVLANLSRRGMPGLWWCHVPNGGYRGAIEAAIFKSLGVIAGVPDLLLVYSGKIYALELKATKGRLSPAQIRTHEQMRQAGATVATATGIDEALEQLELWGLLRSDVSVQRAS
jgi:VRR-NUC domain-containing protein